MFLKIKMFLENGEKSELPFSKNYEKIAGNFF